MMQADTLGDIRISDDASPLPGAGARCFEASQVGSGLAYTCAAGELADATHLTCDFLLDSPHTVVLQVELREADRPDEPFTMRFGLLPYCQARLRLPLAATDQSRWMLPRDTAILKPSVGGYPVQPSLVTDIRIVVLRKAAGDARWSMTELQAASEEPPALAAPLLPRGPVLDALGQSTTLQWPGRTPDEATLVARLHRQRDEAASVRWPASFSEHGGWKAQRFDASGFFRSEHDGKRWWLVDPLGHPFWSAGCDCVRDAIDTNIEGLETAVEQLPVSPVRMGPHNRKTADYLQSNLTRAFGQDWSAAWETLAFSLLRKAGFNTVGNWSDTTAAARAKFPYVRPMRLQWDRTPMVFRDFLDVFDPRFDADATAFAQQLADTADDPSLIGYFLMNEPTWGFATITPAQGMLLQTERCATRDELVRWLRQRYADNAALVAAWGMPVTFGQLAQGRQRSMHFTDAAKADLTAFSSVMVRRLFDTLSAACRQVDPSHMNLGARYYVVPPDWALEGMTSFDCFSINGYGERIKAEGVEHITKIANRPVMIGEYHFGALDAGLPSSGIGHVPDQAARGDAYRVYLEDAAANPNCVGAHWFTLYDQSALGRFDGENYNIGFLDVCHRPYEELFTAARASHERLYDVASGKVQPFDKPVKHLPWLFI